MTWTKLGTEFFDQLADLGLSDAAVRTHVEAIAWLYGLDRDDVTDLSIPKHLVARFASSPDYDVGIKELVAAKCWRDAATVYHLLHHADVVRGSLMAQRKKRETDKERQRRHRSDRKDPADPGAGVTPDVTRDVADTQTDKQTGTQHVRDEEQHAHAREDDGAVVALDIPRHLLGPGGCAECKRRAAFRQSGPCSQHRKAS